MLDRVTTTRQPVQPMEFVLSKKPEVFIDHKKTTIPHTSSQPSKEQNEIHQWTSNHLHIKHIKAFFGVSHGYEGTCS